MPSIYDTDSEARLIRLCIYRIRDLKAASHHWRNAVFRVKNILVLRIYLLEG